MSRRGAREVALKTLFVLDFTPDSEVDSAITTARENIGGLSNQDMEFCKQLIVGTKAKQEEIDLALGKLSKEWQLSRMGAIDRNLLRMAAYEINFAEEKTPASVVINEAVELAKIYGTDESAGFVNGILGALVRDHE